MNQAPTVYESNHIEDKLHPYKQIKVGLMNQAPTEEQIPTKKV